MQHYGLPTRLLDWTHSSIISAYFATKYHFDINGEYYNKDAAIWMLDPIKLNVAQGYEPIFPPLNAFNIEYLIKPALKGEDGGDIKIIAASPLESDMRMLIQQGAFTVHVTDEPMNSIEGSEFWLKKILIPEAYIPNIALELDALGIRLADVFPDLHNLAIEITNNFRPL